MAFDLVRFASLGYVRVGFSRDGWGRGGLRISCGFDPFGDSLFGCDFNLGGLELGFVRFVAHNPRYVTNIERSIYSSSLPCLASPRCLLLSMVCERSGNRH